MVSRCRKLKKNGQRRCLRYRKRTRREIYPDTVTDILGIIKSWAIPVEQLEEAFENGVMFDGSSIQGFTSIEESDMKLVLDPSTFRILPWRPVKGAVARILGDVYPPDGKPFQGDPRYVLKSAIKEAQNMGFSMQVGPDIEFFLFKLDANGNPTTELTDQGGYFDFAPLDQAQDVRREIDMPSNTWASRLKHPITKWLPRSMKLTLDSAMYLARQTMS